MSRIVVMNHVTLDGVMQAPGRPDEDTRGGFSQGGCERGVDLFIGGRGRHVGFNQLQLGLFFVRQLGTVPFAKHVRRLAPLFDQCIEDLQLRRLVERLHGVDGVSLQGRLDHAYGVEARFLTAFHRRRHVFLDLFE